MAGWPGYVRGGVFVIEKRIHTVKWHVSTHCTSLRAAMKQLERFEVNPAAYRAEAQTDRVRRPALVLDLELVEQFHAWHSVKATRHWARNVRSVLIDWANHLRGADLRALDVVRDLKPHLRGATQAHHRAKSIKLLMKWLRQERGLITRAQDVALDLPIPIVKPAQQTTTKAVPWASVVAVAAHLAPHVRDVLELLAATGWHVEEARRFAAGGTIRERNAADPEGVLAVLGVVHKSGRRHFTALLQPQHVAVATRVRERGHVIDNGRLRKHMLRAARLAGVPAFQLGSLRHSVATWLTQAGVPLADTSRYLGHASTSTTGRHYVDHQAAAIVLPARALRVV